MCEACKEEDLVFVAEKLDVDEVDASPRFVAYESAAVFRFGRVEQTFFLLENGFAPQLFAILEIHLKLPDVADIRGILLLDLAVRVLVNPEVVLLVNINFGLFVRTVSSEQPASDACSHYIVLLSIRFVWHIINENFDWRTIDQKNDRSTDLFVPLLLA
jgi:hypothetical protein